jgi:acetyl esterase/lipase
LPFTAALEAYRLLGDGKNAASLKQSRPRFPSLAQIDPRRSEGEKLAELLQQAGVKVNLKTYEGVTHEFFGLAPSWTKPRRPSTSLRPM